MNKILKFITSGIVSMIILFFLYKTLGKFDSKVIGLYFTFSIVSVSIILYLLIKIVNTFRYNMLFNKKDFFKSINILFFSNFLLTLIPFRLGEASYIQLFKKHYGIGYSNGLKNLIFLRVWDYVSICVLMLTSLIFLIWNNIRIIINNHILTTIGIFFSISIILIIFFFIELKGRFKSKNANLILEYISDIKKTANKIKLLLLSLVYWTLRFYLGIYLFWSVGINLDFFSLLFISTMLMLVSLIPIQTFAGFGIFEGTWTAAFLVFGITSSNILNLVLAVHLLGLFNVVVFGIISFIILYILIQNKSDHTY